MKTIKILWILLFTWIVMTSFVHAGVEVAPMEKWGAVFAGKETVFHFSLKADEPFRGRLGWRFASSGMSLVRGEKQIGVRPGQVEIVEIRLPVPKLNEGVVMPSFLSVSAFKNGERNSAASFEKPIWIFSEDSFANKRQWLSSLKIHLFDPEQKTVKAFNAAHVPFKELHNIDAIPEIESGLLIIGEGISLTDYRGLSEIIFELGVSGRPVLCLALKGGEMLIPVSVENVHSPLESMMFRKKEIIKIFDKRFDADAWPPDGEVVVSSVNIKGGRGAVIGEIINGGGAWPWMEFNFSSTHGKVLICGFGMIEKWDSGPMPRFLFAKILEYMADEKSLILSEK